MVLIGDIPLPVVNKGGQGFLSLLPYTDFLRSHATLWTHILKIFVLNPKSQDTQVEVWHGVIKPPLQGQDGVDLWELILIKIMLITREMKLLPLLMNVCLWVTSHRSGHAQ